MCYEQGVINFFLKSTYKDSVKIIEEEIFTNTSTSETSRFILHLFGEGKIKIPSVYEKLKRHQNQRIV